jgi:hypothetical protein
MHLPEKTTVELKDVITKALVKNLAFSEMYSDAIVKISLERMPDDIDGHKLVEDFNRKFKVAMLSYFSVWGEDLVKSVCEIILEASRPVLTRLSGQK